MADITEAATCDSVVFTANTADAEKWMQRKSIEYYIPGQMELAGNFAENAKANGFTVAQAVRSEV